MNFLKKSVHTFVLPFAAASILLASTALGQENTGGSADVSDHPSMVGFGFHGGANFNDFNYTNNTATNATNARTGWLAGLHLEGISLGYFALRLEANYSVKGYDIANIARVDHNYLQIPVLFKISPIIGPIEIYAEAGPAIAIHLNSTTTVANTTITYNDNSSKADFSLIAGLGLGIKLDRVLLEVEGRYDYGLTNLSDNSTVEFKSRAIQAIAGVTFLMN